MKGLIYAYFAVSKLYYIITGILSAVMMIVGAILSNTDVGIDIVVMSIQIFAVVAALEFLSKDFHQNMTCGFTAITLTAVTHKKFVLTELVKNLLITACGAVLEVIYILICYAAGADYISDIPMMLLIVFVLGLTIWCTMPVLFKVKNQDAATLIMGAPLFVIAGTLILIDENTDINIWGFITENKTAVLITAAVAVALLYALFTVIFLKVIKKGG